MNQLFISVLLPQVHLDHEVIQVDWVSSVVQVRKDAKEIQVTVEK